MTKKEVEIITKLLWNMRFNESDFNMLPCSRDIKFTWSSATKVSNEIVQAIEEKDE